MRNWDDLGKQIDRMAWPERLVWVVLAFGGASAMTIGPYEFVVSVQGKLLLLALFSFFLCGAGYLRVLWLAHAVAPNAHSVATVVNDREGAQATSFQEREPAPDMPIWELFYLLAPNWKTLERRGQADVAQRIRDALALNRLKSWGRPTRKRDWISDLVGHVPSPPPEPIEPEYWRQAEFTYSFMNGERRDEFVHAEPSNNPSNLPKYTDVQLDHAQAENVFGIARPVYDPSFLIELRSVLSSIYSAFEALPTSDDAAKLITATSKIRGDLLGKGGLEATISPMWDHLTAYAGHSWQVARLSDHYIKHDGKMLPNDEEALREHQHFQRVVREHVLGANAAAVSRVDAEMDYARRRAA